MTAPSLYDRSEQLARLERVLEELAQQDPGADAPSGELWVAWTARWLYDRWVRVIED